MSSEEVPNTESQTNINTKGNVNQMSQEEMEEQKHFSEVLFAHNFLIEYGRRAHAVSILPKKHLEMFPPNYFQEKLNNYKECIKENTSFLSSSAYSGRYGYPNQNAPRALSNMRNMNKVVSTLHQFVRDWSVEGQKERDEVYKPIIDAVLELVPLKSNNNSNKTHSKIPPPPSSSKETEKEKLEVEEDDNNNNSNDEAPRILCPGSGLCRLPFEFAAKGYTAQCNEFSYQMLLAANYVLNKIEKHDQHIIYPYIDNPNNIYGKDDNVRPIKIPDIAPSEVLTSNDVDFSMCAGEFLEVYNEYDDYWDVVASCFFLDTAPNIIEYLECIYKILKPNGYLINVGPLLYHWSSDFDTDGDIRCEQSIELSYEEIIEVMKKIGFKIIKENRIETSYTANERSMMHTAYNAVFFIAQK